MVRTGWLSPMELKKTRIASEILKLLTVDRRTKADVILRHDPSESLPPKWLRGPRPNHPFICSLSARAPASDGAS